MKIRRVTHSDQKREFEVITFSGRRLTFPYAKTAPEPTSENRIHDLFVDMELGKEAFTYTLESGDTGSVHIDSVLEYNADPSYVGELLLYKLTLEVQKRIEESKLSKRELIRKLNTSPAQLYRLLDQTNYRKSITQMVSLLHLLGCEVELSVRGRAPTAA